MPDTGDDESPTVSQHKFAEFPSPLAQSMGEFQATRTASLLAEGKTQIQYPQSNEGFFRTFFMLKGRALDLMFWPWVLIVLHAVVYTVMQEVVFGHERRDMEPWEIFFSFVLNSTLSFLLVFRLNRAAGRYWDARGMWGSIVAQTRSLVGGIIVHGNHNLVVRDEALRWIAAFPIATMELLRSTKPFPLDNFAGILTEDQVTSLQSRTHPPIYAADKIRYNLQKLFAVDDNTPLSNSISRTQHLNHLEEQLNTLIWSGGGMERIKGSPLPVVYVSHLRTFLLFNLLLFPYVFGPSWGWSTIPVVAASGFAWLGIECAAAEVECPFRKDRVNALNMNAYVIGLLSTMQQQLTVHAERENQRKCRNMEFQVIQETVAA